MVYPVILQRFVSVHIVRTLVFLVKSIISLASKLMNFIMILVIMKTLKINIQSVHPTQAGKLVDVMRNTFELPDGLVYDYQQIINGAYALFPNKELIINLTIM